MNPVVLSHCVYHEDQVATPRERIRWWDGSMNEYSKAVSSLFEEIENVENHSTIYHLVQCKTMLLQRTHASEIGVGDWNVAGICFELNGKPLLHLKKRVHSSDASTVLIDLEEMESMCELADLFERTTTRRWWKITAMMATASALVGWWWGRRG